MDRRRFLAAAAAATCACALTCPFAAAERREREDDDDDDDDDDEREHQGRRGGRRPSAGNGDPSGGGSGGKGAGNSGNADAGRVDVGALSGFTRDGASDNWVATDRFLLVRAQGRLYAMSAACTHKGVLMKIDGRNVIHCAKHDSLFDNTGTPTKGPATRHPPLERFAISTDARGHVLVDTSRRFTRDQWNDPAAFVKVK